MYRGHEAVFLLMYDFRSFCAITFSHVGTVLHNAQQSAARASAQLDYTGDSFGNDLHRGNSCALSTLQQTFQQQMKLKRQLTDHVCARQELPTLQEFLAVFDGAVCACVNSESLWPAKLPDKHVL